MTPGTTASTQVGLVYDMRAPEFGAAPVALYRAAIELHGGIGFMKEYHLHHFHNRSATQRGRMGAESTRLAQLGDVVVEALDRGFQDEFVDWLVR